MAQAGNIYAVSSQSRTDFTGTLAQNAGASWRPALPAALGGRSIVRGIVITSVQNLDWEVFVYKTSNANSIPPGGTIDNIHLAGKYRFFAADGVQIAATGSYLYYIDGLTIAYHDLDSVNAQLQPGNQLLPLTPYLNVVLVNRSATGKNANDAGAVVLRLFMEATNG